MRMKEDHMRNGQLKPGYNLQATTEHQLLLHYTIHQTTSDSITYIEHLDGLEQKLTKPKNACADAGYGSEENYEYLESKQIESFVKYNNFHFEQKKKYKDNIFRPNHLFYNSEQDFFICPMGQKLKYKYTTKTKSKTGFESEQRIYQAVRCTNCPMRGQCHKSKENRKIGVNFNLLRHRKKARENLMSEKGLELRSKRPIEVEAVFGHIKWNRGFKRFLLRGLKKVNIEIGLIALAHNSMKLTKLIENLAVLTRLFVVFAFYTNMITLVGSHSKKNYLTI